MKIEIVSATFARLVDTGEKSAVLEIDNWEDILGRDTIATNEMKRGKS